MTRDAAREKLLSTLRALDAVRPYTDLGNSNTKRQVFNDAWSELWAEASKAAAAYVEACRG